MASFLASFALCVSVCAAALVRAPVEPLETAFDGQSWVFRERRANISKSKSAADSRWKGDGHCETPPPTGYHFFSQFGEDEAMYNDYFCNKRGGTFVEIGALDGKALSNTKFFDDYMGWSGMLIEAFPDSAAAIEKNRPNPKNKIFKEAVCGEGQKSVKFSVAPNRAVGGVSSTMPDEHKKEWGHDNYNQISVPCRPIRVMVNEFLAQSGADHIDFFSLDVEGGELEVLKTFDFHVPVNVWMIELDGEDPEKDEAVRQVLQNHGYTKSKYYSKDTFEYSEVWVRKN